MLRTLRHTLRLFRIARILARHDAIFLPGGIGWLAPVVGIARLLSLRREAGRPGQRLGRALQEAGPSFIKLGQALSCRPDLTGEAIAEDLTDLQDRLPPFPGAEARRIIADELGAPVERLFATFEDVPIAAASIAQVHFATCTDGRPVAVKVQRPGIEAAFAADLELFLWIAEMLESTVQAVRRLKPVESVRTLARTVAIEMDLRFEAAAASELAENFKGDANFRVPAVDWSRTARRVLTTERVQGLPMDERDAVLAAGLDPRTVLGHAARAFFLQVFRDGFFHGDLHAGNLFVCADGSVAVVDFGIMGRLDRQTRRHLGELMMAFLGRDYRRAAEVHFAAGWIPGDQSVDAFTQACRSIGEPILDKPQNEISLARLLGQLFEITATFGMETQPQLLLLQKTMLVAEGTSRRLCPDANMWFLARPLVDDWVRETFSAQAQAREAATAVANALKGLPEALQRLDQVSRVLASGTIRLDAQTIGALRGRRFSWPGLPWLLGTVVALLLILHLID